MREKVSEREIKGREREGERREEKAGMEESFDSRRVL